VKGFLLDENVPYRLRFPLPLPVTHSTDLGDSISDTEVWNFAKQNEMVIITKDADFSDRIAAAQPPPWVVHLRVGNMRRNDFHAFLEKHWPRIFKFLPSSKLINVYLDRIETLS
jgi:predicted nuclease of predicted toxin-antitoxin system